MVGEQHFITFDQRHFEYKGRCQHLLVADMVGGRWAVSVNYHHHSSRTIIIYVHDAYIEISKDFRVSPRYHMSGPLSGKIFVGKIIFSFCTITLYYNFLWTSELTCLGVLLYMNIGDQVIDIAFENV